MSMLEMDAALPQQGTTETVMDRVNEASPYMAGEGRDGSDWRGRLPEDIREHEALMGIKDVGALARRYLDVAGDGADRPMPPDSPDGYEISVPDGLEVNPEAYRSFLELAHKAGLSQDQVNAFVDFNAAQVLASRQASDFAKQRAINETRNMLQKEWGPDFGRKLGLARRALDNLAEQDVKDYLAASGLEHDPGVIRLFARIGDMMGEDVFLSSDGHGPDGMRRGPGGMPLLYFPSMEQK